VGCFLWKDIVIPTAATERGDGINILKNIAALCIVGTLGIAAAQAEGKHWTYGGHEGSATWGSLDPGFATCASALIDTIWTHLPKKKEKEVLVEDVTIDATELLPAKKGYYTFQGSLTTPPCSEDVRWLVLKTPLKIAGNEIAAFGKIYPMNARPTQPLNGRELKATK
jgi:carbonic anhydrase